MRELKYVHNMTAQQLIDEVYWEEETRRRLRNKIGKRAEQKLIERIAWNNI